MSYAKPDNWVSRPLAYEDSGITGTQPESVQHKRCLSSKNRFHYGFSKCVTFQNKSLLVYFNGYTPVVHLPWKKGVCRGRAAFDIIFQHKTTFSLKTSNRPMNFAMLPKYHIGKIPPMCSISAIFVHKSHYAGFLHGVFGNPNCYFVSD